MWARPDQEVAAADGGRELVRSYRVRSGLV
jgi:hypothetical protein